MVRAEFPVEAGAHSVVVEVEDRDTGRLQRIAGGGEELVRATRSFEAALAVVKPVVGAISNLLRDVAPDEAEVELGVKLSAQAGAILTKVGGDAHIVLTLKWKRMAPEAG